MKNLFKVTGLCAALLMAGSAVADTAEQTFQWTGSIPAKAINDGALIINNTGTIDFSGGQLTFKELANGNYQLNTASAMMFDISEETVSGNTFDNVKYVVSSVKYSSGGGFTKNVTTAAPEFSVSIDGSEVIVGDVIDTTINKPTTMSLVSAELDSATVSPEDEVVVQATLLVTFDIGS